MNFTKKDALKALVLGFFIPILMLMVIKNLDLNLPINKYWLIVIFPLLVVVGLFISFKIAQLWRPFVFQFGKFFVVGLSNTFLDLGVLNFLIYLTNVTHGVYFAVFKAISFACAVTNSFLWNKYWTFQKQGSFTLFFLVVLGSTILNVGWASYMVDVIGVPDGISPKLWDNIAALSSVVLVLTWNFLGMKYIVFKKKPTSTP
ncbi:MAG: GtrA family protein [Candidatus Sungbacteria bacterium]|uniref:GtrA family protein n=1 Tax=Candidatus Sungiibacteriota bacterium TaxID=2750080 RepID=A0A931YD81_9BACT|nr:GtrA family protein [Candidatus Sungbacteria bacterium]